MIQMGQPILVFFFYFIIFILFVLNKLYEEIWKKELGGMRHNLMFVQVFIFCHYLQKVHGV